MPDSDKLLKLLDFLNSNTFKDMCQKEYNVDSKLFERYVRMPLSNFTDTLSVIIDEVYTEELLNDEEEMFIEEFDETSEM